MAVDPEKTYHGRAHRCGETLRWKSNRKCVACIRAATRARMARVQNLNRNAARMQSNREDHIYRYRDQLRNRRIAALKRQEARNGQV